MDIQDSSFINAEHCPTMSGDEEAGAGATQDGAGFSHDDRPWSPEPAPEGHDEVGHPGRNRLPLRSPGSGDLPQHIVADAAGASQDLGEGELLDSDEATANLAKTGELPRIVLGIKQDVQNIKNELHLHGSTQFSVRELRELKDNSGTAIEAQTSSDPTQSAADE
ncbi:MAG TPA: hypothetical protein VMB79_00025 [Jatrophihabitans sp.]|nr:hypothetical protein [Jatrophihabitans sp.]